MKLEILNKDRVDEYESFLLSQPDSLFYHSIKYKNFLEDLLKCESHYLLALNSSNKIIAALPLMIKDGPFGRVINSLPYYGSNGGIIGDINNPIIINLFKEHLESLDYISLTLVASPDNDNISKLLPITTDQRLSQITPLNPLAEDCDAYISSIIASSTRRNINKSKKIGIQVSIKNKQSLSFLEEVHNENMLMIGGKPKSHNFFAKIPKYFIENTDYKIYTAEIDSQPVAALLVFFYNKTVEYFTPVIKCEFRDSQPMASILSYAIADAMRDGFEQWNWGGTWLTQVGVYQFKKKWGAIEKPYNYATIIKDSKILKLEREFILKDYDGFYIYNFNRDIKE